ncbi:MAG: caspase family protein [Bacteroidaceae bacterium]|nr:caspase family protein [Bacteroidaceae bacterium]
MLHSDILRYVVATLLLMTCTASPAKVYVVSAGVADYPGDVCDLRLPVNDAKTIAWLYEKNCNAECRLITDSDATKANIDATMRALFTNARENDLVVFFFSGHGGPAGICTYDQTMLFSDVRKAMAVSKCRNKMIFVDACFSGKIRTSGRDSTSHASASQQSNVMLFLSSRSNETSLELASMDNGLFTTYLQKGLRGGADYDRNRIITAKELFNYVSKSVRKASDDRQHPVMWGKFSNNMPVMIWLKKQQ